MKLNDVGVVVASRTFALNGEEKVTVLIGKPEKFPDEDDYFCPYQIVGVGSERVRHAAGVDAVQALQLAMQMIGADLSASKQSGKLTWLGDDELGFSTPDAPPA
jgi:hypothetical protein